MKDSCSAVLRTCSAEVVTTKYVLVTYRMHCLNFQRKVKQQQPNRSKIAQASSFCYPVHSDIKARRLATRLHLLLVLWLVFIWQHALFWILLHPTVYKAHSLTANVQLVHHATCVILWHPDTVHLHGLLAPVRLLLTSSDHDSQQSRRWS